MSAKGQDRCGACMVLISKLSASASARARCCDRTRIGGSLDRPASCPEAHYQRFVRGESGDRQAPLVCKSLYPSARRLCQFPCRLAPASCRRPAARISHPWERRWRGRAPPVRVGGSPGRSYLYLEDSCLPAAGDRESPSARAPARAKLSVIAVFSPHRAVPVPRRVRRAGACPPSCGRSRSRWRPTSSTRPRASSPSARIPPRSCTPIRSSRSSVTWTSTSRAASRTRSCTRRCCRCSTTSTWRPRTSSCRRRSCCSTGSTARPTARCATRCSRRGCSRCPSTRCTRRPRRAWPASASSTRSRRAAR